MRQTPLAAMLTLLVCVLVALTLVACGGKGSSGGTTSGTTSSPSSTTSTGVHKKPSSKTPGY